LSPRLRNFLDQKGLSLAELTVGFGILGITSLMVMNLAQNGARTGSQIGKEFEISDFQTQMTTNLNNVSSCTNSVLASGPVNLTAISNTNSLSISNILNNDNEVVLTAGEQNGSYKNGVRLVSIKLEKYNSSLKTADLVSTYTYNLDAKSSSVMTKKRRMTVSINPNAAGTGIENCYLASSSTDALSPKVVIEQDTTQVDPASTLPIKFVVSFDEPIDPQTFSVNDITNLGTASGIVWSLTTSDNTTWTLSATDVTVGGTLIPTLPANAIKDKSGNKNLASTSTDNTVTYNAPSVSWEKNAPFPSKPDSLGNATCNTTHTYTLKNNGATTSSTITTSLSSTSHFTLVSNNCNNITLAAGASCKVQVRFNGGSLSAGSYSVTLQANIGGGVLVDFGISATKVSTDPCASSPVPGTVCGGCNTIYAGSSGGNFYYVTPGGCSDSSTPSCSGSTDSLVKIWSPLANQTLEGASSTSDGSYNTNLLISKTYTQPANYCYNLIYDGKLDWFLPSSDEMTVLYNARDLIGGFDTDNGYQTSTEKDATESRAYLISQGSSYFNAKSFSGNRLRCVRKEPSSDSCYSATAPASGTSCSGGAKFVGSLSVAGTTARYMVTPGGCTDNADDTSQFNATCAGGTDTVTKTWGPTYDHPSLSPSIPDPNSGELNSLTLSIYSTSHPAARYCHNLNYGGYSDWFLPNREELNLLYTNRVEIGGFSATGTVFNNGAYWSSTEGDSTGLAHNIRFGGGGTITTNLKVNALFVRCVRRY